MPPLIKALRPHQWIKNAIVLAALIFAYGDRNQVLGQEQVLLNLLAVACFCMISSSIYLINDAKDVELDRQHPTKRFRPIAAGQLSIRAALITSGLLTLLSLGTAFAINRDFGLVILAYYVMQLAYTQGLKRIAFVDVTIIALGFVLRALGGALAISVTISPWLLLCTMLLALFLGLCKRRHEKVVLSDLNDQARPSLKRYSQGNLDAAILFVAGATVMAYALYTVAPDTIDKFGSRRLMVTVPLVAAGLYRYFRLVYQHEEGGRPEKVLLTDPPLILTMLAYGVITVTLFLLA
ncbi:MAG: 4-hydroxybenzoate polyprenyltransferase [Kiritimatiellia bacterium]|jgi:4-hydroxybenzoate polyprenyltransferase